MDIQTHAGIEILNDQLHERVRKTINSYLNRNSDAVSHFKIDSVRWNLSFEFDYHDEWDNLLKAPDTRPHN